MYSSPATTLRRVPARLVLVAGLHGVVLWALVNGIGRHTSVVPQPGDVEGVVIDRVIPPPQPYVPPDPTRPVTHLIIPTPQEPPITAQ